MGWVMTPSLEQELERSGNVSCVVDPNLRLVYCNPAWDRFALSNDGPAAVGARVINTDLMRVTPPPLHALYERLFADARLTRRVIPLDYECSSPATYRLFRMEIRPLTGHTGFAVVHALRLEQPHNAERTVFAPDEQRYATPDGLITVCAHCRKTRRVAEPSTWDWVPHYLQPSAPRARISHGLCGLCLAYFYPTAHRAAGTG